MQSWRILLWPLLALCTLVAYTELGEALGQWFEMGGNRGYLIGVFLFSVQMAGLAAWVLHRIYKRHHPYPLDSAAELRYRLLVRNGSGSVIGSEELAPGTDADRAMEALEIAATQLRSLGWEAGPDVGYGMFVAHRDTDLIEVAVITEQLAPAQSR